LRAHGGSWNSTGPSVSPSAATTRNRCAIASLESASFAACVMRRGAFSAKRKSGGTRAAQPASTLSAGIR
jgi:hypothetical protein